jgi:DNA-binding NarL/FixJ family response regulator
MSTGRPLTTIEQRVAVLVAEGRTNPEVADELGLTDKAVEWHLSRAYRKLGVHSRGELTSLFAKRRGASGPVISQSQPRPTATEEGKP